MGIGAIGLLDVGLGAGALRAEHDFVWGVHLPGREFVIDNLLVRHFIIVMIRRTVLAPWEFDFPFPGSLTSTFL